MPGDSLRLYSLDYFINTEPVFDGLLTSTKQDGDRKISFFSLDGGLLKEWFVRDKDEAGNRFFNENNWRKYKKDKYDGFIELIWVYDFTSNDVDRKDTDAEE